MSASRDTTFSIIIPKKHFIMRYTSYVATLFIIWLLILFYRTNSYYVGFLSYQTQQLFLLGATTYTIGGLFWYGMRSPGKEPSKSVLILQVLRRVILAIPNYLKNLGAKNRQPFTSLSVEEKTALLFYLVKIFFLPIMINFLFGNIANMSGAYNHIPTVKDVFSIHGFNTVIFPLVFALFLVVDTAYFCFGYLVESNRLHNKVRSVEPTFLGWFVALICYPPFVSITSNYFPWYENDYQFFWNDHVTFVFRIIILLLFFIYVWATVALGAKSSNLTNRGIVARGPYAFLRHPAYITKNLAWWVTLAPIMSPIVFANMFVWSFIYFMRAITEERHLSRDPDYREYVKKVKYRFIPGVW